MRAGGPAAWAAPGTGAARARSAGGGRDRAGAAGPAALLPCLLTALYAPRRAFAGVLPTPTSLARLGDGVRRRGAELREQATPALPLAGLLALTTLFVGLIAVAVDLIAVAGRQAALAGLGLLVLYCVPVSTITGGIGSSRSPLPAVGLALLLWADQRRRIVVPSRGCRPGWPRCWPGALAALRITSPRCRRPGPRRRRPDPGRGFADHRSRRRPGSSDRHGARPGRRALGQLTLPEPMNLLRMDASVRRSRATCAS